MQHVPGFLPWMLFGWPPLLATHYRYIVPNICSNPSICPYSFLQAYNATPFKWLKCNNRRKMLWTIYCRMTFGTFMTICMWEYMPVLPPEGYTVYWCDCLGTPYSDMCVSYVVVGYLMTVMYCSYSQRPSPSIDGWCMVWMIHDGHMITRDECGPNFLTFRRSQVVTLYLKTQCFELEWF